MKVAKKLHDSRSWKSQTESKNSFCFVFVLGEL